MCRHNSPSAWTWTWPGTLNTAGSRLDDLVSRERAFSADASHQLRTPLAALRIELEAMELRGDESLELPAAIAQADRLQDTIDTLLAVARDVPRSSVRTLLGTLLDEAEARWRESFAAHGRPLRLRSDDPALVAGVSASVMREIVDVLLANALRHGRGGVDVRARAAGASIAVDVADEGSGAVLDPKLVFERRSETARGHGIGLALRVRLPTLRAAACSSLKRHRPSSRSWSRALTHRHADPQTSRLPPATGQRDTRQQARPRPPSAADPLLGALRPLCATRVQVGAAEGAARRKGRDAITATRADVGTGHHVGPFGC